MSARDAVLADADLRLRILARTLPERLVSHDAGARGSAGKDCALFEHDEEQLTAYGCGSISAVCKTWRTHTVTEQFLLVFQRDLLPGRGDGRFADSDEWFGVHNGPSFLQGPLTCTRHATVDGALSLATGFMQQANGLLTHEWHTSGGLGDQVFPAGTPSAHLVSSLHKLMNEGIKVAHAVGKGVRLLIADLREVHAGRRELCDRACESRRTAIRGNDSPHSSKAYTSTRVCPCCCSKACAAEFPAVPHKSVWFGTGCENVLKDALVAKVGQPGETWCKQCEKFTTEWPQVTCAPCGPAFCHGCNEDLGCDECWPDHGSFCETCNVFECDECQDDWYNGDLGIFCGAHRPHHRHRRW